MTLTPTAPSLVAGWEAGLPDSESLCLRWVRHWADQCAAVTLAAGGTVLEDERYQLADHGRTASFFNAAVLLAPPREPGELASLLDEIEARTAGGRGDVYLWSLWPTPDLRRRGWQRPCLLRLRTEPHLWHVGVFSDDSRPGAERLGFIPTVRHTLWHRPR